MTASTPARIVTTSSDAHEGARIPFDDLNAQRSWSGFGFPRYGQTKLANILFTVELARRLAGTGVTANCFHPGFVATHFNRNNGVLMPIGMALSRPFARSAAKGAETLVWLVDSEAAGDTSGGYFFDEQPVTPSAGGQDRQAGERVWAVRGGGAPGLRRRAHLGLHLRLAPVGIRPAAVPVRLGGDLVACPTVDQQGALRRRDQRHLSRQAGVPTFRRDRCG